MRAKQAAVIACCCGRSTGPAGKSSTGPRCALLIGGRGAVHEVLNALRALDALRAHAALSYAVPRLSAMRAAFLNRTACCVAGHRLIVFPRVVVK